MKSLLQNNDVEINSTLNKVKSIVAERFIRNLRNKIYRYITSISQNAYIDKLDDIANKYKNTNYSTIKMKPVNLKLSTFFDFYKENNKEDPKFKIVDHVRIYQNIKTSLQKITL